jgi:hypothetical protein
MKNIEKEFIPHEQALALKELGFNESCLGWYQDNTLRLDINSNQSIRFHELLGRFKGGLLAPTYQQAFRWFREKYNLASHIATYWQHDWNNYSYQYYFVEDKIEWNGMEHYKTYEEAELECLKKLIEIVKNK